MPYLDPKQKKKHNVLYYLKHRRRVLRRVKRYYAKHRSTILPYIAQWQKENAKKHGAYTSKYQKNHRKQYSAYYNARMSAKTKAGGAYTSAQWIALCDKYCNRCLCCGKKRKLTADHVVPVSKGGSSNISNIQPLCGPCNSSKGTRSTDYRRNIWRKEKTNSCRAVES